MHELAQVRLVEALATEGLNASAIAARTGVPRGTVRHWLRGEVPRLAQPNRGGCPRCGCAHDPEQVPAATYSYLLGMYLGDGCLLRNSKDVWRLEITLDMRYPGLIAECADALRAVMPSNRVAVMADHGKGNFAIVRCYSKAWLCLFPRHGPGRKHERHIALDPWQERIVDAHPQQFVRGLIHSDGCRALNRVNGKDYPRYFVCQVSEDIKALFCSSLTQLGVHYTRNDAKNVSIARRASVARLDELVGPKA